MSELASKIATTPAPTATPAKRGPANCCYPLYGAGDLEDWEQVEALRAHTIEERGRSWREVQQHIDGILEISKPLSLEKFKYHWRRMCYCWPEDLRRS